MAQNVSQLRAINQRLLDAIIERTGEAMKDTPIADAIQETVRAVLFFFIEGAYVTTCSFGHSSLPA